ncbi:MAG: F0F1 ATP synthase subunit epsilon [Chloroflexi bacterium]|nr:F0F1 ATP synthase subunit epsilon [Chloroflexota bacterium]MDE2703077.1 F0F1 ATP synthase subunit epsilon [Chloroflexota bacterium]MXW27508.1 F0F1 ATP synthase subunit epsilon [Chloroflexota bacterium]MXX65877.1 F0F1 ATP synthase subunit epsilon [Chloroflexota bacterium]MXY00189.1 F0F1 ATP synthase subunit epsilon [Chloroflexota bacterium]
MDQHKLTVELITPERSLITETGVEQLVAPSVDGQVTILPRHAPLLTILDPGVVLVRRDGSDEVLAVSGGFLQVQENRVTILADASERSGEVDRERAERARAEAERQISEAQDFDSMLEARIRLMRALSRLRAAERGSR